MKMTSAAVLRHDSYRNRASDDKRSFQFRFDAGQHPRLENYLLRRVPSITLILCFMNEKVCIRNLNPNKLSEDRDEIVSLSKHELTTDILTSIIKKHDFFGVPTRRSNETISV